MTSAISANNPPFVSVIVAAYNCEKYIDHAIRSTLQQTYPHFELIVIDDGSTDQTGEIALNWAAKDARVQVIRQSNSGTAAGARNTGLRVARGDFICFLDGDDFFHPERLNTLVEFLQCRPEIGMVFHDVILTDLHATPLPGTYLGNINYLSKATGTFSRLGKDTFQSNEAFYPFMSSEITGILTCSVMIRDRVLREESVMFDPTQRAGEDIDLWFRIAARCRVGFIDRALSYYRQHPTSISRNSEAMLKGFLFGHENNFRRARGRLSPAQAGRCKQRLAKNLFYLGSHYYLSGQNRMALKSYVRSMSYAFRAETVLAIVKAALLRKRRA